MKNHPKNPFPSLTGGPSLPGGVLSSPPGGGGFFDDVVEHAAVETHLRLSKPAFES